nr:hypothetical protein CFP56_72557 [Quercus suber]
MLGLDEMASSKSSSILFSMGEKLVLRTAAQSKTTGWEHGSKYSSRWGLIIGNSTHCHLAHRKLIPYCVTTSRDTSHAYADCITFWFRALSSVRVWPGEIYRPSSTSSDGRGHWTIEGIQHRVS